MLEGEDADKIVDFSWHRKVFTLLKIVDMLREGIRIRLRWGLGDGKWMKTKGWLISWVSLVSKGEWVGLG